MGIEFSEQGSELFFYVVFALSAVSAGIGANQHRTNKYIGSFFFILSFLILFVPLGLRTVGLDHSVYVEWFDHADYWLILNYHFTPEPLFAALTLVAKHVFDEFQIIYIFAGFVYLAGIYIFLRRSESIGYLSILFMSVSLYLYMCGLARISIAIGFVSVAYTKLNKKITPLVLILVATLFHYSALIAVLVFFSYRSKKNISLKNLLYMIIGMLALSFIINRFSGALPYAIRRYSSYVEPTFSLSNITSSLIIIPSIILWLVFNGQFKVIYGKAYSYYDNVMKIIIGLICLSMVFNGLFRLTFFFYPFVAKVYSDFTKVLHRTDQGQIVPIYSGLFTALGLIYVYAVFYTSPFITPLIIPFAM